MKDIILIVKTGKKYFRNVYESCLVFDITVRFFSEYSLLTIDGTVVEMIYTCDNKRTTSRHISSSAVLSKNMARKRYNTRKSRPMSRLTNDQQLIMTIPRVDI